MSPLSHRFSPRRLAACLANAPSLCRDGLLEREVLLQDAQVPGPYVVRLASPHGAGHAHLRLRRDGEAVLRGRATTDEFQRLVFAAVQARGRPDLGTVDMLAWLLALLRRRHEEKMRSMAWKSTHYNANFLICKIMTNMNLTKLNCNFYYRLPCEGELNSCNILE